MFNGLGIQWAGTLLGCVAILLIPIPVGFYVFGAKLRERSRFSPTMGDKPPPPGDEEEELNSTEQTVVETETGTNGDGYVEEEKRRSEGG